VGTAVFVHGGKPKYEGRLKVRGLTLLLRVGTLCRCGDGLFFEVSPLASDALLSALHPLLENALQTVDHFKILASELPFHGWKSPEIAWAGQDLDCMADVLMGFHIHYFQAEYRVQFRSRPAHAMSGLFQP
jgi:hypothetical protein